MGVAKAKRSMDEGTNGEGVAYTATRTPVRPRVPHINDQGTTTTVVAAPLLGPSSAKPSTNSWAMWAGAPRPHWAPWMDIWAAIVRLLTIAAHAYQRSATLLHGRPLSFPRQTFASMSLQLHGRPSRASLQGSAVSMLPKKPGLERTASQGIAQRVAKSTNQRPAHAASPPVPPPLLADTATAATAAAGSSYRALRWDRHWRLWMTKPWRWLAQPVPTPRIGCLYILQRGCCRLRHPNRPGATAWSRSPCWPKPQGYSRPSTLPSSGRR
mmetsp:Transcript_24635/g.68678  ORF Transcript_24635/g.68678 Transcript_24635/m.68678 type:complete len:269 (-) Transcript_24635:1626-2432(-)